MVVKYPTEKGPGSMISYENRCALTPLLVFQFYFFFLLQIIPPPNIPPHPLHDCTGESHKWITDAGLYFKILTVTVSEIK